MLPKLQKDFEKYIISKQAPKRMVKLIKSNKLPKDVMLKIYRENLFAKLISSLKSIYPTVHKIVGEKWFEYLAKEYIKADLPTINSTVMYGSKFAGFLVSCKDTYNLEYLADMARFEWMWYECYNAEEDYPLLLNMIDNINDDDIDLKLRDSVRIFSSSYPIDKIRDWASTQGKLKTPFEQNNANQGINIALVRINYKVEIFLLNAIEHNFLSLFTQNGDLDIMIIALFEKFNIDENEISQILEKFLSIGIFKL